MTELKPAPFVPLRKVHADTPGPQVMYPSVDHDGVPIWQNGDEDVLSWQIDFIGWCHGALANRKMTGLREGALYLSSAGRRAVGASFGDLGLNKGN